MIASLVSAFLALPAAAAEQCRLVRQASVDMKFDSVGGVYVPMTISGQKANMLIDTGGTTSMLSQTLVDALKLNHMPISRRMRVEMYGGLMIDYYAQPQDIDFGGLHADELTMLIFPGKKLGAEEDGALAPNILRLYDADFDFANAKFNLFSQDHCPGAVVYWTKDTYARVSFTVDRNGHIEVPTAVDGQPVKAAFDTGASRSFLSLETAERLFNFDEKSPLLKPLNDTGDSHAFRYPFKTLTFEGVTVDNPDIVLVPDSVSHTKEKLILGMGILRQLHLYIAYNEKMLYVTPASAH
jgi:predicted aspartyl protease